MTFKQSQMTHYFLEGPAGSGKTTHAIARLYELINQGVPAQSILVMVPQRTLGQPYYQALSDPAWAHAAGIDVATIGGLARRGIALFWNEIAESAGFQSIIGEPTFLTIETAQYYMADFIDDAIEQGLFDSISLPRARLIAQSLDNLAKAAVNIFPVEEVTERLNRAWSGHSSRLAAYDAWQQVAERFRQHCLAHNLLDFALQIRIFTDYLIENPNYQAYIRGKYTHLLMDNLEENPPVALDFVRWLHPSLESMFLVYDTDAGYRVFLGAEPVDAYQLRELCDEHIEQAGSVIQEPAMQNLTLALQEILTEGDDAALSDEEIPPESHPIQALHYELHTFYPDMLNRVVEQVINLVESGIEPGEIVILAPYLNDSLRFTVYGQLEDAGIPIVSHRPSRALREEPAVRAVLTLMQLVNPAEEDLPAPLDVADALVQVIDNLDPIRSHLLTDIVYGAVGRRDIGSFDDINNIMQRRITYAVGERYEELRRWLLEQQEQVPDMPPDYFLRRLFGEVISKQGFGLHNHLESGTQIAQLIDSAYNFRTALYPDGIDDWSPVWLDYRQLVSEGLLAALHVESWQKTATNAVFIAPAYTYLVRNRPADYQFWLDAGSNAWSERLDQPLTHPYVLRRNYPIDQPWDDEQEVRARQDMLYRLVLGLARRCRKQIILGIADLGEQGFEQRGLLLRLFQNLLQRYRQNQEDHDDE